MDAGDYARLSGYSWFYANGYAVRKVRTDKGQRNWAMHRDILPDRDGFEVDHGSRDKLDNRRSNLRYATRRQQLLNREVPNGTSGYAGVGCHTSPGGAPFFQARIRIEGARFAIGVFDTPEDAARAYDTYARRYHGAFAVLNLPDAEPWTMEDVERIRQARKTHARSSRPAYLRVDEHLASVNAGMAPCNIGHSASHSLVRGVRAGASPLPLTTREGEVWT